MGSTLFQLPKEILTIIFCALGFKETALSVRTLSRTFYDFITYSTVISHEFSAQNRWSLITQGHPSPFSACMHQFTLLAQLRHSLAKLEPLVLKHSPTTTHNTDTTALLQWTCCGIPKPDAFALPRDVELFYSLCNGFSLSRTPNESIEFDTITDVTAAAKAAVELSLEEEEGDQEDEPKEWWQGLHHTTNQPTTALWLCLGREGADSTLFVCCDKEHVDHGKLSVAVDTDGEVGTFPIATSLCELLGQMARGITWLRGQFTLEELVKLRDGHQVVPVDFMHSFSTWGAYAKKLE
eukprot:TRINITY_DN48822_c0_g1_i1.p1 TRINITY_DN48822_c0_g1~~TRINITY_DN48822_c0_g1_i1.p1  ORF type:complete len:295 (-),score=10.25 TRINITY_DN48822_c0_g1_i1:107-991(-)